MPHHQVGYFVGYHLLNKYLRLLTQDLWMKAQQVFRAMGATGCLAALIKADLGPGKLPAQGLLS